MPRLLTCLKVKIGLRPDGGHLYPNFNALQIVKDTSNDWSKYVDVFGEGWRYDKTSGHRDDNVDSPYGFWWGMLVVPKVFADQATAAFPNDCENMTEVEATAFYNNKHAIGIPSLKRDADTIDTLEAERQRLLDLAQDTTAIDQELADAKDPDNPKAGVKRNPDRDWSSFKSKRDIAYQKPSPGRSRIPT